MQVVLSSVVCLVLCLTAVVGQSDSLEMGIERALQLHDAATDFGGEMKSVQVLEEVGKDHPNHWLPPYWAAFVLTQASMSLRDPAKVMELAERAQSQWDRSWELKSEKSKRDLADFYTLQSLIHGFKAGVFMRQGQREQGLEQVRLRDSSLDKAALAEPSHPRVLVLKGTSLISQGIRNSSAADVLAGRVLLERAKALYEAFETESDISPDWSRPWIDFWLENRAKLPEPNGSDSASR